MGLVIGIEVNLKPFSSYWRASLVPAAAVTPAPVAYIKVVAVKTLVVETWAGRPVRLTASTGAAGPFLPGSRMPFAGCVGRSGTFT